VCGKKESCLFLPPTKPSLTLLVELDDCNIPLVLHALAYNELLIGVCGMFQAPRGWLGFQGDLQLDNEQASSES